MSDPLKLTRRQELTREAEEILARAREDGRDLTAEEHKRNLQIREECDKLDKAAKR